MNIKTCKGDNLSVEAKRSSTHEDVYLTIQMRHGHAFIYLTRDEALELAKALRWEVSFLEDADRCVPLPE